MKPLKTYEAAKKLDCTQRTIRRLLDQGKLHGFKMGGTWRIQSDEIDSVRVRSKAKSSPKRYGVTASKTRDELLDLMGEPSESFSFERLNALKGPIVYACIRENKCHYIGRSYNGLARPFDSKHQQLGPITFLPGDELLIWPCANSRACDRIEGDLIAKLKPALNRECVYVAKVAQC